MYSWPLMRLMPLIFNWTLIIDWKNSALEFLFNASKIICIENFKTNWMCWGLHGNWTFSCLTSLEFKSQIPTYIELSYILQSIVNQILNVIFWFCIDKQTTHNERHTSPYFDSINSDFLFVCFLSLVRSNFEILWFGKIKFKTEKFPIFIRFVSALFSRFHS